MAHVWCPRCGLPAVQVREKAQQGERTRQYRCIRCGKPMAGPACQERRRCRRNRRAYRREKEERERG